MEDHIQDKSFPFSLQFQITVLKMMITEERFLMKCIKHVRAEYFNDKYLAWAFKFIVHYYNEYSKMPTIGVLENEVKKMEVDVQKIYLDTINSILHTKELEKEYIRHQLLAFIRRNKFIDMVHNSANQFNSGNEESAYQNTQRLVDELVQISFDEEDRIDFQDVWKYIEEAQSFSEHSVPIGVPPFEKEMHGGLHPGTLTVILSGTNMGKSMIMVNMAKYAILSGKKVLMLIHEDSKNSTALRLISCFTNIPLNKLYCTGVLSDEEKAAIKIVKENLGKMFHPVMMHGTKVNVEDVCDYLRLKKKEFDFDFVIDDYGQFITTKYKTDKLYEAERIVYNTLKQIALELNVPLLTCAQGNRDAQRISKRGIDVLRSEHISECFAIARLSDCVITLNRSDEHAKNNEMVLFLEKIKNGVVNIAVKCMTDFSRCKTHDPKEMYQIDLSAFNNISNSKTTIKNGLED